MRAIDLSGLTWRKSSYSNPDGGACVEVSEDLLAAARWRKSRHSNTDGGNCVEVSDDLLSTAHWYKSTHSNTSGGDCLEVTPDLPSLVPVRDSKDTARKPLVFGVEAWAAFVDGVREG